MLMDNVFIITVLQNVFVILDIKEDFVNKDLFIMEKF